MLMFAALFLPEPEEPAHGASGKAIRAYLESNQSGIGLYVLGGTLTFLGMIVFVVALRSLMQQVDAGRFLTDLATAGGLLTAVWMWVAASVEMIPLVMADEDLKMSEYTNDTLLTLDLFGRLSETLGDISTVPRGLMVLAVSLVALRTRFVPRWIGHVGLLVSAASLVSVAGVGWQTAALSTAWFVGLFGFFLWALMIGVTFIVQGVRGSRRASVEA